MKKHLVNDSTLLLEALSKLNSLSGDVMTLFVIDSEKRVIGSLTDGDVRRGLIAGATLQSPVTEVMHSDFKYVCSEQDNFLFFREMRNNGIELLPEVDADGVLTNIIDLKKRINALPIDAVLMAGGRGERLRPLTLDTPKPLLEVGGKPIIDYNIDELIRNGVTNIFVTVNYLHEQIEQHFTTPRDGVQIKCVVEPQRMGTIGSLSLCNGLTADNILVMNSDLLTTLNFEQMYAKHIESGADITMAVIPYSVNIPFAIINTDKDKVSGMTEKPTYNYLANAGIYILKRELLASLPSNQYVDAPDFVTDVIRDGGTVAYYQIDGTWIDIGSPDDYRYANELMKRIKDLNV